MACLRGGEAPEGVVAIELVGEQIWLLPERALYWPARQTLFVADLHWGKDEALRTQGLALPEGVLAEDLERLGDCLARYAVDSVIVLGDLIHNRAGVSSRVAGEVGAWRKQHSVKMVLVPGNHDRWMRQLPVEWGIHVEATRLEMPPFTLVHEVAGDSERFLLGGHVHPVIQVGRARQRLRFPCFYFGSNYGILPAFSHFTGGYAVERKPRDRCFAVTGQAVIAV